MEVKIEQNQDSYKEILFSVTPEEMERYLNRAAEKLSQSMSIKGFREGKIPRKVVEKSVGAEKLWHVAAEQAIEDKYWEVIEDKEIKPMGMPKIEVSKMVPGNNLEFKASVPVMPNLDLPDYRALAKNILNKDKKGIVVSDKEVEQSLQWLQRSRAETSNTKVDAPEAAPEPKLPEVNDEFARNIGDFKDLNALKGSLKEGLMKEKEQQEKQRIRLRVLEEIRKKTKFDLPDFLIDQEVDKMQAELQQQVEAMNMKLEDYLKQAKKTLEEVKKGWRDKARERIESAIILKAIAEKEDIKPSEKEIEEEAGKYLRQFKNVEDAETKINPERLKAEISGIMRNEKVFELLEDNKS